MPWSFKAALAAFVIVAIGAALIVFAHFQGSWEAITSFTYGLLTAGMGLFGALVFSIVCAMTRPEWRGWSLIAVAFAVSLAVALFFVWRAA